MKQRFQRWLNRIAVHFTVPSRPMPMHVGSARNFIRPTGVPLHRVPAWVTWLHGYLRKHYG